MDFNVQGKKITIMGLGLLGRGIGDAKFLISQGAQVTITDLKTEEQLSSSVFEINEFYKEIRNKKLEIGKGSDFEIYEPKFVLGKHREEDFTNADFILMAAGVPLNSPFIDLAKKNNIPVKMDDSWFAEYCQAMMIGITGTRGKSTTTTLIYEILKAAYNNIYLAGNLRGLATLPLIDQVMADDKVVLELSSWQLQGWRDAGISPHVAVITNILPDHLDYYGSMEAYVADKKAIYQNQKKSDFLILNKDNDYSAEFGAEAKSKIIWFSKDDVPADWQIKLLGEHNLSNIAAAIKVGEILGVPIEIIKQVVENFGGVEGRLQFIREYNGAKIYNDNNATTPEAVMAALNSFDQPVVLLAGGAKKKVSYADLAQLMKSKVKNLILFKGAGSDDLLAELKKINFTAPIKIVESMGEAISYAQTLLNQGDIFLFSPGAASFGVFVNEYDRNDQFLGAINKL